MPGPLFLITLSSAGLFALLIPAILIGLANGRSELALEMALVGSIGAFTAIMLLTALSGRVGTLERELNFVSLVLVWLCTPLVAAVAIMILTDTDFMTAWFEAVAALTTSGATTLPRETLPISLLFWRASLEWYGGFLTLISIIHVLAPAGFGGLRPSGRRRGAASRREGPRGAFGAYSAVFWQYGAVTVAIGAGLVLFGVVPSDAIMLAMVSIATGGFLPFSGPLEERIGNGATFVMALGFCFGTLSVFWRRNAARHPLKAIYGSRETMIVFGVIAILTITYAARIADVSGILSLPLLGAILLEGFFTAASLVATSGIETRPGVIALLPEIVVLGIVLIGASVYSTTGGIKYYRVAAMGVFARAELNRLIFPRGVSPLKFDGISIPEPDIRAVWSYFVLALLCIATGSVLITLTAADFEGGLAMAITFFATASPAYEALRPVNDSMSAAAGGVAGWPTYAMLPDITYLPAIMLMTIGRLEVLIVFAVLNVRYWLNR